MDVVLVILQILLILSSVCLIVAVLLQSTKSAGLGGAYGGDTQSFTARGKAASKDAKLQKATKILAIVVGVVAIAMAIIQ